MDDEHDEHDEPTISFTDDETAFLRHVRFGELPGRVPPEERVELTETDGPRDVPEHMGDPHTYPYGYVGGAH